MGIVSAYTIRPFETDIWGMASPAMMIKLNMDAIMAQSASEGVPGSRMYDELGAVWMLARLRMELTRPVLAAEQIDIRVSGRKTELATMRRVSDFIIGGERVGGSDMAFMIVKHDTREIIRPAAAGFLWDMPEEAAKISPLRRLRLSGEMDYTGQYTVRSSQCDSNGHLSSSGYADAVCDMTGHWRGEPCFARHVHIEYNAECPPDSVLRIYSRREVDAVLCKGLDRDGGVSFLASFGCEAVDTEILERV